MIRLVLPRVPMGVPVVMMTRSPWSSNPALRASSSTTRSMWSVSRMGWVRRGKTPQERHNRRQVSSRDVTATMGVRGRNRLMSRAVPPPSVLVRMAAASRSRAISQAA